MLASYPWLWGLPWSVVYVHNVSPLENTDFLFPRSRSLYHFSLLHAGILLGLNLYRSCVCCHILFEFTRVSSLLCSENSGSLVSSITSQPYNLSTSSFAETPAIRDLKKIPCLGYSEVFTLYTLSS